MNITDSQKKALLIFGGGLLLFFIFKPKMKKVTASTKLTVTDKEDNPKDRKKIDTPTADAKDLKDPMVKNAFGALKGYVDAYNNGEPQSVLDELNREFSKEFKVKVYRRKSDGKLVVYDLSGSEILVNN
jgi:hypothetical protein